MHQELTITYGELLLGMALCFGFGLGVVAVFWQMAADARLELESITRTSRICLLRQVRQLLPELAKSPRVAVLPCDAVQAARLKLDLVIDQDATWLVQRENEGRAL